MTSSAHPHPPDFAELRKRFSFIDPIEESAADSLDDVSNAFLNLADTLVENCPSSRELSLALTHLEESMNWARNAVTRNQVR